jgi:acyl carrier protein
MEDFLEKMAELFEVDNVQLTDKIIDFEAWDSLTCLSIIAFAGEEFQKTISASQVVDSSTIGGLYDLIVTN